MAWSAAALLFGIFAIPVLFDCGHSQTEYNSFDINLRESAALKENPQKNDFTPPTTQYSTFQWESNTFGQCYGCGRRSYKEVTHDCVHRQPMQLSVGNYSRTVMGVFKATKSQCGAQEPNQVRVFGCGPPCSELRLLRGAGTWCRCDRANKVSINVPKLICQDHRNQTKPLSLCKDFYEKNTAEYQPAPCDYNVVCTGKIAWIAGNWSQCRLKSQHQTRDIVCAVQSPKDSKMHYFMHESECKEDRPPKMRSCARWGTRKIFDCDCETKLATRPVVCRRNKILIDEAECSWYEKPRSERPCEMEELADCPNPGWT